MWGIDLSWPYDVVSVLFIVRKTGYYPAEWSTSLSWHGGWYWVSKFVWFSFWLIVVTLEQISRGRGLVVWRLQLTGFNKDDMFRYKELYEKYGELPELGDITLGGKDETITLKLCIPEKGVEVNRSFSIYDTVSDSCVLSWSLYHLRVCFCSTVRSSVYVYVLTVIFSGFGVKLLHVFCLLLSVVCNSV